MENKEKISLIYASLLHDIGKICYRTGSNINHSELGWEFLYKNAKKISDDIVIKHGVLYHHGRALSEGSLPDNSLAHIVYEADNLSSALDRRDFDEDGKTSFKPTIPLSSIFNLLFETDIKNVANKKTYPANQDIFANDNANEYTKGFYNAIVEDMSVNLREFDFSKEKINSFLGYIEGAWRQVPSSTDTKQLVDISLFDHSKTTAAIATCMYDYFKEDHQINFKKAIGGKFKETNIFTLTSVKLFGAEDFIFNISGSSALKSLRARSFYTEILLEHVVDHVLANLELFRPNLLFYGGNEATLLLPNTDTTKNHLLKIQQEINSWCRKLFGVDLFFVITSVPLSPNDLKGKMPYKKIFERLAIKQDEHLNSFFSKKDIIELNNNPKESDRECTECQRLDCKFCEGLVRISNNLRDKNYFVIGNEKEFDIELPFNKSLNADILNQQARDKLKEHQIYTKFSYIDVASTKLYMADYDYGDFETIIEDSQGTKRLGTLLINIDNFSNAFINGFADEFVSISRTTEFSRGFVKFFKEYLNDLLKKRTIKARVIYSSGDEICVIGAWRDLINFAIYFYDDFNKFALDKMTISMAISMFKPKFPVSRMITHTKELMAESKKLKDISSITVFDKSNLYSLEDFKNDVIEHKLRIIQINLQNQIDIGAGFIYKFLDFVRESNQINISRLIYLISRIKEGGRIKESFADFLYQNALDKDQRQSLILALEIFILESRDDND